MAHSPGRSALTALGIVLGVAILFGVLVSSATTNDAVDELFEDIVGRADVTVRPAGAFASTMPGTSQVQLEGLPGVEAASAVYGFPSRTTRQGAEGELHGVQVLGVDLDASRAFQNYELVSGRFPEPGADEIILPRWVAEDRELTVGGLVTLGAPTGPHELALVGILTDSGAGRSRDAITSLDSARRLGGVGDGISGVSLILSPGTDVDGWIQTHQADLGPGYLFANARNLGSGFRDFLTLLQSFFAFFAAIALFVGAFLIYLTLSMSVVERTRTYGTMRALGATRGQVARVVMSEAAVLGALSTVAGLVLGLGAARGLLVLISQVFDIPLGGLTVTPGAVLLSAALGLGVTLASSIAPAVRAGRLPPVVAMRGEFDSGARVGRGWLAGVALVVGGSLLYVAGGSGILVTGVSTLSLLFGAVLVVPVLLGPLAATLGGLTGRIVRGVGEVAVLHLVKERSRSAYTLGLIMVVMAMLFAIGAVHASVTNAVSDLVDRQFGADLRVFGPAGSEPGVEDRLRAVDGVAQVSPLAFGRVRVLDTPEAAPTSAQATFVDPDTYFEVAGFAWADGDDASAQKALREGGSVIVSDHLAGELAVGRGDVLTLETVSGPERFTVAATYVTLEGPPTLTMGVEDGRERLRVDRPAAFLVAFSPGADADAVHRALLEQVVGPAGLTTTTAAAEKAMAQEEIQRYFRIVYAILLFAAAVGLLGLANTLAMSVLRRYREIGVLRAIGVTRNQVVRMVVVESATMGAVALVLALPLGSLLSALVVRDTSRSFGLTMDYVYPAAWVPLLAVFGAVVAVAAAIAPGRRAARLEVVGALQYE